MVISNFLVFDYSNQLQWNPSIMDTFGEQSFGRYTEVAFVEGLFCVQTLHLGPVYLAVISQLAFLQGWPLRGVQYSMCFRICTLIGSVHYFTIQFNVTHVTHLVE